METIVFDGKTAAARRHAAVGEQVKKLRERGVLIQLASVFFAEDRGSVLYTKLKRRAAEAAGIAFAEYRLSMVGSGLSALETVRALNEEPNITGIIIQKPTQAVWQKLHPAEEFENWWHELTGELSVAKDIDGLTRANLNKLRHDIGGIVPATVKAVLIVLEEALNRKILLPPSQPHLLKGMAAGVVGCSDIIGGPLAEVLEWYGCQVSRICRQLERDDLLEADLVVSATGVPGSITGEMIKQGAIVIDVGTPRGNVDFSSAAARARFITPVPGGVGPLTVVSLLENTLALAQDRVLQAA